MIQAKWLFEHHLQHEALASFCEEQLKKLSLNSMKRDAITSMVLVKPSDTLISGSKREKGNGSSTEYAALHWQEHVDRDLLIKHQKLAQDLENYQYYIQLYRTVMSGLNSKERWLIKKIYEEGNSPAQLLLDKECPYKNFSKSTLHNRKNEILKKADMIVNMCLQRGGKE